MTVLVGYTTTPQGQRALEAGIAEAQVRDAPLHVVRVFTHELGDSPTRTRQEMEGSQRAFEHLEGVREELAAKGLEVTVSLLHGSSGQTGAKLVEEAGRVGAKLIVIGIRPRTPVGKLLLGSTAQDVLLAASCPVLAVKAIERGGRGRKPLTIA